MFSHFSAPGRLEKTKQSQAEVRKGAHAMILLLALGGVVWINWLIVNHDRGQCSLVEGWLAAVFDSHPRGPGFDPQVRTVYLYVPFTKIPYCS